MKIKKEKQKTEFTIFFQKRKKKKDKFQSFLAAPNRKDDVILTYYD